jgi:putative Holliday junction resolvase
MSIPLTGRVLALDWGLRRIGIARSDEGQVLATPETTLSRREGKRFPMPAFLELVAKHQPVGLVVGLPLSLEGAEGDSAAAARELADLVGRRTGLPVDLTDERMTTARVLGVMRETGTSSRDKEAVDASAAAVLLQNWLDRRRGGTT